MARGFIKDDRDQIYLLPPSIDDWISKDHPVRFVQTCLEQMSLQKFYESYAKEGRPPYDPRMMLGILIYAYSKGMRSSRKISKACEEEVPFVGAGSRNHLIVNPYQIFNSLSSRPSKILPIGKL